MFHQQANVPFWSQLWEELWKKFSLFAWTKVNIFEFQAELSAFDNISNTICVSTPRKLDMLLLMKFLLLGREFIMCVCPLIYLIKPSLCCMFNTCIYIIHSSHVYCKTSRWWRAQILGFFANLVLFSCLPQSCLSVRTLVSHVEICSFYYSHVEK